MKQLHQLWREDDGGLTFEWVLLVTILTIGIVSGLAAARDGIIDEFGDVTQAAIALDQSYRVDLPIDVTIHIFPNGQGSSDSEFVDGPPTFNDDNRVAPGGPDQAAESDIPS